MQGGCSCGKVRYRLKREPMIVHCCHCSWCQCETGSAFVLNAVMESDEIELLGVAPEAVKTPSASGRGQIIMRCPTCHVAVWSHYSGMGKAGAFIRVGTLDDPNTCPPDVHIFTSSKQDWVVVPAGAKAFAEFYQAKDKIWSPEASERRKAAIAKHS